MQELPLEVFASMIGLSQLGRSECWANDEKNSKSGA